MLKGRDPSRFHILETPPKIGLAAYGRTGSVFCCSNGNEAFVGRTSQLILNVAEVRVRNFNMVKSFLKAKTSHDGEKQMA